MTHSFPTRRSSDLEGYFRLSKLIGFTGGGSLGKREEGKILREHALTLLGQLHRDHPERDDISLSLGRILAAAAGERSEEHTSELQSLMRISYAVFCLKKKKHNNH